MKKKLSAVMLAITFIISAVPVKAELPNSYFGLNDSFNAAVSASDYNATIYYGVQIIDLISAQPQNTQTHNIIGSKSYEVGFAYYLTGDYENALKYFRMYIPYGEELNWSDGVTIAREFVKQLPSSLEVYKRTETPQKTYGVKNEPNGVLYGQVSENMRQSESMVLLYLEYGDERFSWANKILREARAQGKTVELALNYPYQADTARSIRADDHYLSEFVNLLSAYSDVPIFLRIGAEFNIWDNKCNPEEFISSFRIIADAVRGFPNVSTVWGVAHTSTWKTDAWPYTMNDFYPGDEYVDWVGTNCYANKYFQGRLWSGHSKFNEICYKSGYSSDPVLMIRDIVEAYGDRKPIMLSECGAAYRTNGDINETHSEWAEKRLREIYSYIPMVYPQVKLIAYFNKRIDDEICYYDLEGSAELNAAYNEMADEPWFVQGSSQNSAEMYFEKQSGVIYSDGSISLYSYPHLFGSDSIIVDYYIDGSLAASETEPPYIADISGLNGSYNLRVTATGNNGASLTREYTLNAYSPAERAEDFTDSSSLSDIQKTAVDFVVGRDIMSGYEDRSLRPYNSITRAEFAAIICRMMNYNIPAGNVFQDCGNHWARGYINACAEIGIIHGVGDNRFAPDSNLTVEQAMTILTQLCGYASDSEPYPDGYMSAARRNNMLRNLTNTTVGTQINRIDSAMAIYNISNVRP